MLPGTAILLSYGTQSREEARQEGCHQEACRQWQGEAVQEAGRDVQGGLLCVDCLVEHLVSSASMTRERPAMLQPALAVLSSRQ